MTTLYQTAPPQSPMQTNSSLNPNNNMRRHRFWSRPDDADAAAGASAVPKSRNRSSESLFEDIEPVLVLGVDISHLSRQCQFILCAAGVFGFSLFYSLLQELIAVKLCNRKLGLFLAVVQFSGYTMWSYLLRTYVYKKQATQLPSTRQPLMVPIYLYLGLSLLRAIDLAMTNLAMQYVNYPAKTLMKSSRVVFTMLFGVLIARKKYRLWDYLVVVLMVSGLVIFMHADANSSAVFHSMGIIMLTVSLICDGAISNMSETIMHQFGVGQDEFIFRMYSIALVAISAAAGVKGDLFEGMLFLSQPGTYAELDLPLNERTWSISAKWTVLFLFSTMGFFGSSCSAAITKNFGALTMSITSTARKALSLFLSFMIFNNECTLEHVGGIVLFLTALIFKSYKTSKAPNKRPVRAPSSRGIELSLEMGSVEALLPATIASPGRILHRTPSSPKPIPGSYGVV